MEFVPEDEKYNAFKKTFRIEQIAAAKVKRSRKPGDCLSEIENGINRSNSGLTEVSSQFIGARYRRNDS